jgi:hypothetical protein
MACQVLNLKIWVNEVSVSGRRPDTTRMVRRLDSRLRGNDIGFSVSGQRPDTTENDIGFLSVRSET